MTTEDKQVNYVDLYNQLNQSLSIKMPNGDSLSLVFVDLSTNMNNNDAELTNIYNKLNAIFKLDTNMEVFAAYNDQLIQLSFNICNDVNAKLADGTLEPFEIVDFVSNSLNLVTSFITSQMEQRKDDSADIKNLVMHYVLSLMVIILSALETAGVVKNEDLTPVLKKVDEVVSQIQLINQVAVNMAKINGLMSDDKTKAKSCCVIS